MFKVVVFLLLTVLLGLIVWLWGCCNLLFIDRNKDSVLILQICKCLLETRGVITGVPLFTICVIALIDKINTLLILITLISLIIWVLSSCKKLSYCDWNPVCGVPMWKYLLAFAGIYVGIPLLATYTIMFIVLVFSF